MIASTRTVFSIIVLSAALFLAGLAGPVQAKYKGGVRPICTICNSKRPANAPLNAPSGTATSLSEGNFTEMYSGPSLSGGSGGNISLDFNYDSFNADGSLERVITTMGVGWTHSYNIFLFKQRMEMFRYDGNGRVTKYTPVSSTRYVSTTGYFETLTRTSSTSFTLTYKDQTTYEFALVSGSPTLDGLQVYWLKKISHPRGTVTNLTYTGGLLREIADTYGRKLILNYNAGRKLFTITDPGGKVTTLQYDATNTRLLRIVDPEGKAQSYGYNALYQMTQKIDRDGRSFSFGYQIDKPLLTTDSKGANLFSQTNSSNWATDANALATQLLRVYTPSTTFRTDGRGNIWQYDYDEGGYITRIQAPDGAETKYTYDPATLQLASVTDANLHTTHYGYDSAGNLASVTNALSQPPTTYTYDSTFNQLTSMTDANGRITTYDIDPANGNRLKETDPLGQTREWTYDNHGNVLSEKDKRGNLTTYVYDAFGNRNQTTDRVSQVWAASYDAVGNVIDKTDPLGHKTCYQYDGLNRLTQQREACGTAIEKLTVYTYDGQGNRTQVVDANNHPTTYQYDHRQRLVKTTDALPPPNNFSTQTYDGNDNRISYTDKNTHTTAYQYDEQNRLVKTTDALGHLSAMTYDAKGNKLSETDANGHTTTYTYDELDRMKTLTDAENFVMRYEYDMTGTSVCAECTGPTLGSSQVFKQTDGNNKVTYFTYDGLDRQVKQIRKEGDTAFAIDASDAVTTYGYDQNSNRLSLTEPNGNTTSYEYDNLDRQTKTTNAAGDVWLTNYNPDGTVHSQTAPNGNVTLYTYDAQHRATRIDDSVGLVATYTYDLVGNRLTEKDGNGNGTAYDYDPIYRVTDITDALGNTTHYDYDPVGNLLKIADRNIPPRITAYLYDKINRRIQTTDALGNITQYQYDGVGNLKKLIDANGHATDYDYDHINRLITETYADGGVRRFDYDAVNLTQRTDQKLQDTFYIYNDLYFMLSRDYPGIDHDDSFTFDLSGRMLSACRGGSPDDLPADSCAGWLDTFTYDGANRVKDSVQDGKTVHYDYNIPGRTRLVQYPGGREIKETTDFRSQLSEIRNVPEIAIFPPPPPIVAYTYDSGNRVLIRAYRNGTTAAYSYNENNWITGLDHKKGATLLTGFAYNDYDNEGNKLTEKKQADGAGSEHKSEAYQYDDIYRLIDYKAGDLVLSNVPAPVTQTQYNLDPVGNWDQKIKDGVPETRSHSPTNEISSIQIDAQPVIPVTSDPNGNTRDDGRYVYDYDEENRLTDVTRKSDGRLVGHYDYDALSRRVSKTADPVLLVSSPATTRYFYDDARIVEEQDSFMNTLATYVYGNYIDEVLTMDRGLNTYYYHQNALWSVEAVSDSGGSVVERYAYDAYGQPTIYNGAGVALAANGWGTPHSALGNPWMFTGRQLDEETGLYFYRARYYDPGKGRFLQRDSLRDAINLYEYAKDRPMTFLDPSGYKNSFLCSVPCSVKWNYWGILFDWSHWIWYGDVKYDLPESCDATKNGLIALKPGMAVVKKEINCTYNGAKLISGMLSATIKFVKDFQDAGSQRAEDGIKHQAVENALEESIRGSEKFFNKVGAATTVWEDVKLGNNVRKAWRDYKEALDSLNPDCKCLCTCPCNVINFGRTAAGETQDLFVENATGKIQVDFGLTDEMIPDDIVEMWRPDKGKWEKVKRQ